MKNKFIKTFFHVQHTNRQFNILFASSNFIISNKIYEISAVVIAPEKKIK